MIDALKLLPAWILYGYVFLIGLCVGSFLNVVILRGLSGEDIVFGRSHCPVCKNNLKWYMNIPLFSYLFLRGKCAFCKCHISFQYPLVEFLNGVLYLFSFFAFGFTIKAIFVCAILSLFIVLAATDILKTVILDVHSYILFGICLLSAKVLGFDLFYSFFCAFSIFILFEYISLACMSLIGVRCFGFGDSLILLGIGALFNLRTIFLLLFISFIIQMLISLYPIFKAKNYRLFLMMTTVLLILGLDSVLLYFNSSFSLAAFYISSFVFVVVLFFSIFDIRNKTTSIEEPDEDNQLSLKDAFCSVLRSVFILLFLFKKLFKKGSKVIAISYLLFIPILACLGIYVYKIQNYTLINNIFAFVCVIVLLAFVYVITRDEEKAQNAIIDDVFSFEKEEEQLISEAENSFTLLPFGPALILASILFIFYSDEIQFYFKTIYNNYLKIIVNP